MDKRCEFKSQKVKCYFGNWEAGYRENFEIFVKDVNNKAIDSKYVKSNTPDLNGKSNNILLTTDFTFKNFKNVFINNNFVELLMTTFYFTLWPILIDF